MKLITLALFLSLGSLALANGSQDTYDSRMALRIGEKLKRDVMVGRLANRVDDTVNTILTVTVGELTKRGHGPLADSIWQEWAYEHRGRYLDVRNIGDHKPLSDFLKKVHEKAHDILGELCEPTHVHDLFVINFTAPVVFNPCGQAWDRVEYKRHFAGKNDGEQAYGLIPVVGYWAGYAACTAGTMGIGFAFVCSTASGLAERGVAKWIAPPLSDWVYKKCG